MKKLFNHFNEIDINLQEFEEVELSEFEKAQYKDNLRKQIKKNSSQKWKKGIAAAGLAIGIGATSLVGLSYTTFAQEIPFVNSIFKLFSEKEYGTTLVGYDKFAEAENMTVESNGTTITITETLLDSKKLFVSYSIETDKDLGPIALIDGSFTLDGRQNSLFHAEHDIDKIAHNKYAGMTTAILPLSHSIDGGTFQFNIRELSNLLEFGVVVCNGDVIEVDDLKLQIGQKVGEQIEESTDFGFQARTIKDMERELIIRTLHENCGHQKRTAEQLGISVRGLRNKIQSYGIKDKK